ncbi:12-oxophytodienoate reductase 1 [Durotheca rogersii]|uniref:12-oxophytodienoate reductase 1 n=1 Tax=Durotheca rogersii TaxID=419775 RepID=UPI00222009DE|nr:12-oxophytodienoate reductase 1 [Durotheca rogersii]KAI5861554.1 12-oxophytodienoate reductase 1 [Durotheca rogersii]
MAATTPTTPAIAPLKGTKLFAPLKLGLCELQHRIVQAPCTRMRGVKESDGVNVPGDLMVQYYGQRATRGGLQIVEAADIARYTSGYPGVCGVFAASQVAGWKRVADAVHARGGFAFLQIWHAGRASPPSFRAGAAPPSAGGRPMDGAWPDGSACAECPPTPMARDEIAATVRAFAEAAARAVDAGFDGVELHGANGYLLDQFLHDNINDRTDEYGGSVENRCRFPLEVVKAVCDAIGPEKAGVRLSPWNYFQSTMDSDRLGTWSYLCEQLVALPASQRPVYVHMIEPRFDEVLDEQQKIDSLAGGDKKVAVSLSPFREILQKGGILFVSAGCFDRDNSVSKLESGATDLVAYGRWFIANPDLPKKLADGIPFTKYDRSTFYFTEPPEKGYADYPIYAAEVA